MTVKIPHYNRTEKIRSLQYFMYLFFITCLLQGIAVICLSSWMAAHTIPACNFMTLYLVHSYLSLAAGFFICIGSLIGLWLVRRGEAVTKMRKVYMIAFLVFMLQCAAFVMALKDKDDLSSAGFKVNLYTSFRRDRNANNATCWDTLQTRHRCCGVTSYRDWLTDDQSVKHIPTSCVCPENEEWNRDICIQPNSTSPVYVRSTSCLDRLRPPLENFATITSIMAPSLTVFQTIHLGVTVCLLLQVSRPAAVEAYIATH